MANYYLCETQRARHPYYVESIGVNLWSIEELCYYMKENVYLLDETILGEELVQWISGELGLTKLAKELSDALLQGAPATEFVLPIFRACGYLPEAEYQFFQEQLAQMQVEPQDARRKMKADYLVNYGMYVRAIEEYEAILYRRAPGKLGVQFYAVVLENMAAAYARLFCFEEAAGCLWESYSVWHSRKVYEKYLRLLPLFLSEENYRARLAEIRADRDHAAAMKADTAAILKEGQTCVFAQQWDECEPEELLDGLKQEYCRCTKI